MVKNASNPDQALSSFHQEFIPFLPNPLVVELIGGRTVLVNGNSDIDGTLISERVPEKDRTGTLPPARAAIAQLELSHHIPIGVSTSRSFGEAMYYQQAAGGHGVTICEDGSVISVPRKLSPDHVKIIQDRGFSIIYREGRSSVILSRTSIELMQRLINKTEGESGVPLLSSLTAPVEKLQELLGHPNREQTLMSMDRLASVYIVNATLNQKRILNQLAPKFGLRTFGEPVHLIGADAQKGTPLKVMNAMPTVFFPDLQIQGVLPIFIGNRENDIPSLRTAIQLGGIGVLVGHPDGGHYINTTLLPPQVIKTTKPYGFGIQEAIPAILAELELKIQM